MFAAGLADADVTLLDYGKLGDDYIFAVLHDVFYDEAGDILEKTEWVLLWLSRECSLYILVRGLDNLEGVKKILKLPKGIVRKVSNPQTSKKVVQKSLTINRFSPGSMPRPGKFVWLD